MQRALRHIVTVLLLVAATVGVSGQTLISRSALDSLVRPMLSTKAKDALRVDSKERNIGEIGDSAKVSVNYTLRNNHNEPITITSMRASCSCLKVCSKPATFAPGESYVLRVEFNPAGRSGTFSYDINIYTSLDASHPTERLTFKGEIKGSDKFSHLPYVMGSLRLSRKSVILEQVSTNVTRREHIAIANGGGKSVRPTARTTVAGLKLRCEPEELAPGTEGDIVIEYRPTKEPTTDIETMVIMEGVEASPTERVIRITLKR